MNLDFTLTVPPLCITKTHSLGLGIGSPWGGAANGGEGVTKKSSNSKCLTLTFFFCTILLIGNVT